MTSSSSTPASGFGPKRPTGPSSRGGDPMALLTATAYETYLLGSASVRRFFRVPGNWIWIPAFPLIQLLVFSQLFKEIVQLPGFGGTSYLAYLAPGQIVFTVFFATTWSGANLLMHYQS